MLRLKLGGLKLGLRRNNRIRFGLRRFCENGVSLFIYLGFCSVPVIKLLSPPSIPVALVWSDGDGWWGFGEDGIYYVLL